MTTPTAAPEEVVLLNEQGHPIGTAPKAEVHSQNTPLHLAFSCYIFDAGDRLLLTQRALHKRTWPGVWTNSCCGHPAPGEDLEEAVRRRVRQELGVTLSELRLLLPAFRYRATMSNGTVENEMCPVLIARTDDPVLPDPDEVNDHRWVDWTSARTEIGAGRLDVSPWCSEQMAALPDHPYAAPVADPAHLPAALHLSVGGD